MTKQTRVYLAGAMGYYRGDDYEKAISWRTVMRNNLVSLNDNYYTNFTVFNPTLNESKHHDIVSQNLHYLRDSDIIILNLQDLEHSLGSIVEFSYFALSGKPIITVGKHIWQTHPYMKKFVSYSARDLDEVKDFLKDIYGQ